MMRRARRFVTATLFALTALTGFAVPASAQPGVALRDSVSSSSSDSSLAATPASAGRDYIAEVRSNFTPENRRYSSLRSTLGFVGVAWDIGIGLLLLFSGLSARFRDVAYGRSGNRYVRMLVYLSLFIGTVSLLSLPLNWFTGWQVEHAFGLSNESLGDWFLDEVKATLVGIVAFGVTGLVALAWGGIEKFPRTWWVWLAAGTLPLLLIAQIVVPVAVAPLFNKFQPLADQQLKAQILALAEQAGIPGRNVYEVDKSRQTKKYNAYVSGWGVSQRIVLWDTTLKGMKTDEILFVMAHEMGHYRLAHIWKGVLYTTAASFLLLFLSALLMRRVVARFGRRWGFTELHDAASVPLFMVVITLLSFVGDPVSNLASRTMEHEADTFALEVTHANDAGARAFLKLGSQNRSNPEPPRILEIMQYSHPPLIERIRFALEYRPWEEGRPNKFYAKVSR